MQRPGQLPTGAGGRAAAMRGFLEMLLPSPGDRNVPPDCYTREQKLKQAASPF